jgi:hypothetical protein
MRRIPEAAAQSARVAGDPVLHPAACGRPRMSISSARRPCPRGLCRPPRSIQCRPHPQAKFLLGLVPRADCQLPRSNSIETPSSWRPRVLSWVSPHPRKLSSRHVAGDPANVRAPDRDVERITGHTQGSPTGGAARLAYRWWELHHKLHNPHNCIATVTPLPTEWSAAPVAPSLPDRPPPST